MAMIVRVIVVDVVGGNHNATLYYNITPVQRAADEVSYSLRGRPRSFQLSQRTSANPANSPAIDSKTDPKT
jgi:hypothetical protein